MQSRHDVGPFANGLDIIYKLQKCTPQLYHGYVRAGLTGPNSGVLHSVDSSGRNPCL